MSVLLRRTMHSTHPERATHTSNSEVILIHPDKITSAQIAGAVDSAGRRGATSWVFTLDNGARFEAHEVKVSGEWRPITGELASSIVDGDSDTPAEDGTGEG